MTNPRTIHVPPSSDPAAELIQMCHWISGHFEASWLDRVDWYTLVVARLPGPPPPVSDYWGDEDEHIELSAEFIQRLRSLHNRWLYAGWVINVDKDSAEFEIARELYPTRTEGGPIFLPEKWLRPAMIQKYGDGPENRWAELFPERKKTK